VVSKANSGKNYAITPKDQVFKEHGVYRRIDRGMNVPDTIIRKGNLRGRHAVLRGKQL
jgi:hypothetical protein